MRVEPITYTDYDGNVRTERFYFNISAAEIAKWEIATPGGLEQKFTIITERQDPKEILEAFDELLKKSYGKKSDDGRTFVKNDDLWNEFVATEAYSTLILKFFTDSDYAVKFFQQVFPAIQEDADPIPLPSN